MIRGRFIGSVVRSGGTRATLNRHAKYQHVIKIRTFHDFHDFVNYDELEIQVEKEIEQDTDWIKSTTALQTMKLGRNEPSSHLDSKTIQEHIIARGYEKKNDNGNEDRNKNENSAFSEYLSGGIPRDIHDDHLAQNVPQNVLDNVPQNVLDNVPNESARRVLSSCLTFPLTLTYAHKLLFPLLPPKLNVLIVGARAESSLPSIWWKDCLYNNQNLHEISVRMTGPGIQKPKENKDSDRVLQWSPSSNHCTTNNNNIYNDNGAISSDNSPIFDRKSPENTDTVSKVTLSVPYTVDNLKLLHDSDEALRLLQWADVFMLFNPGMSGFLNAILLNLLLVA